MYIYIYRDTIFQTHLSFNLVSLPTAMLWLPFTPISPILATLDQLAPTLFAFLFNVQPPSVGLKNIKENS